jgi:plastocyanin
MVAVLTAAFTPLRATQEAGGVRHRVDIQRFTFVPEYLVVAPGDTVVWVNRDLVPHTLTAQDSSWDSQALETNQAWELRFTEGMTGHYFCRFHPTMQGQVHVRRQ